ncbi:MAG: hypothetical protein U0Q03_13765 [Acidimicrobiales bacterium]
MSPRHLSSPTHAAHRPAARRRAHRFAVGGLLLLAAVATACGDDDETSDDAPVTTTDTTGTAAVADGLEAACDDYATITGGFLAGQADPAEAPAVLDRFVANVPDEIADDAATLRDGLTQLFGGDDTVFGDPAFTAALSNTGDHLFGACESAASAEVSASDYRFDGLPAQVPAGRFALRFVDASAAGEPHELILLRRPDGDTTPVDELVHQPMDQLMGTYQMAGVVFADQPGTANTAFFELEPGQYVAICTIPTMADEATTHAMAGMTAELEVTA